MSNSNIVKKGLSVLMVAVLLMCAVFIRPGVISAESVSDLQSQQSQLQEEQEALKKEIAKLEDKEAAQEELRNSIEEEIVSLEKEIVKLNERIEELKKEIEKLEKKKEEDVTKYKERLREMYMSNDDSALNALMNSESFSEYLVTQDAIDRIYQQDEKMLKELVDTITEIQNKKNEVEKDKAVMDSKKETLSKKKSEVIDVIRQIRESKVSSQEELDKLEGELSKVSDQITSQLQGNQYDDGRVVVKGDWALPVRHSNPYISCLFGDDYIGGYYRFHKGIDITGGGFMGTPIVAAKDGKVITSEYSGSYGYYIVIHHGSIDGSSYATLYAHMSSLAAGVGSEVKQGQVIGYGGNTGYSFGAHLHYEVRIDGSPVNPIHYLPSLPQNLV